jgi:hypothetical protein
MDAMKVGDELDFKGPTGKIVYEGDGVFIIRGEKRNSLLSRKYGDAWKNSA